MPRERVKRMSHLRVAIAAGIAAAAIERSVCR
jgi:hypothetical protein